MKTKDASFLASVIATRMSTSSKPPQIPSYTYRGQENRIPSLNTGVGVAAAAPMKVYTGDKMIGIATMHKSNSVPVFSQEEAVNISKMRR